MKGLFRLQTPQDLLGKLRHDYARLRKAPDDVYAAFDFFVTAEHMLDWIFPGRDGRRRRSAERNEHLILQVVSHLATGAKHMVPEDRRHRSVEHADVAAIPYGDGSYGERTYGGVKLVIHLDDHAAEQLGKVLEPLELAASVLAHWEDRLAHR